MAWRIEVEERRFKVFYTEATTEDEAREDAEELSTGMRDEEWDDIDSDVSVRREQDVVPAGAKVWTGGPQGEWR